MRRTTTGITLTLALAWALPNSAQAAPPEGAVAEQPQPAPQPTPPAPVQTQPLPPGVHVDANGQYVDAIARPVYVDAWGRWVYADGTLVVGEPPPPTPPPAPIEARPNPNRGLGMMIGGWTSFGLIYVANLAGGLASKNDVGRPLVIPIAGPWITMSRLNFPDRSNNARQSLEHVGIGFLGVLLAIDGLAQVATLALGIAGTAVFAKSRANARYGFGPGGLRIQF